MVRLRPSGVDAPDARELLVEYFALRAAGFPGGGYQPTFPEPDAFEHPRGVFLILDDDDGRAAGCGGIRRLEDTIDGARYEIKHLFVRPIGRGRGWGRMLLEALETQARARGAADLVLDTHHSLEAAGGLYAASGFMQIPRYNDNPNATVWYRKPLVTGSAPEGVERR